MEETALWLELTYDGDAPVVLTGAQRSADAPGRRRTGQSARRAGAWPASPGARGRRRAGELRGHGVAAAGPAQGGAPAICSGFAGAARHRRRGPVHRAAIEASAVLGALRPPTRRGSTSSPCMPAATPSRWTPAWPPARAASCWRRSGSGNAGRGGDRRRAAALPGRRGGRGVDPGAGRAGQRRLRAGPALVDAGAVVVPRLRPAQARVLLMAALAAGSPVARRLRRWG